MKKRQHISPCFESADTKKNKQNKPDNRKTFVYTPLERERGYTYEITIDPDTNIITTYYPARTVITDLESFYQSNSGVSELDKGRLEEFFLKAMDDTGIDMMALTISKSLYNLDSKKKKLSPVVKKLLRMKDTDTQDTK